MKRFLYFLLGYTILVLPKEHIKDVLNISNLADIRIITFLNCNETLKIKIYSKDESVWVEELSSKGIKFEIVYRKGIKAFFKKYQHRIGALIGIFIFFIIIFISPMFIWEINVIGNEKLSYSDICDILKKEGIYIGAFSPSINRKSVYMNVLQSSNEISWLSVNFIGSSAQVEIVERDLSEVAEITATGANIIAKKEGQIFDTEIVSGKPVVKKGDFVNKGDLLVSGIYEAGKFGTRYVYSEAVIHAVVCDEYVIKVPLNYQKCVFSEERVIERRLKLFDKSVNIFKNYSILHDKYDIINRKVNLPLPVLSDLPISIEEVSVFPYSYEPILLTEAEALDKARQDLFVSMDVDANYIEILSLEENYIVENSVLVYSCYIEATENIAATNEFNIQ